jgi:hypothetical protein
MKRNNMQCMEKLKNNKESIMHKLAEEKRASIDARR